MQRVEGRGADHVSKTTTSFEGLLGGCKDVVPVPDDRCVPLTKAVDDLLCEGVPRCVARPIRGELVSGDVNRLAKSHSFAAMTRGLHVESDHVMPPSSLEPRRPATFLPAEKTR